MEPKSKLTKPLNLVHPVNPVCDLLREDRQACLSWLQSFAHRLKHSLDLNVHADPLRARASVTVCAAVDINSLNADIRRAQTAIAPPFCGPKESNDGRARRDGQVRWAGVSTDINLRAFASS